MIRTLSVEGGIMGDFNFLSKFSEMILCYFGIFKDILSSLRKTCPGDVTFVLFFFLLLSLTRSLSFPNWEMRVQQQGRKFLFSPSISFPIWANHFKDSPSPSSSAGFVGCFFCSPHLSREGLPTGGWPRFDKTPFPSIPYLMGYASLLYFNERNDLPLIETSGLVFLVFFFFFSWRNNSFCLVNLFFITFCIA